MPTGYDYEAAAAKRAQEDAERTARYEHLLRVGWSMATDAATGQTVILRASTAKALFGTGKISSMHHPCETYEEAEKNSIGRCKECGGLVDTNYMEPAASQIRERGLCFTCNEWTNRLADTGSSVVVVRGTRYTILNDQPSEYKGFLGYGGARFDIQFFDGREVVSHNLWCGGDIPLHFRDRIPDNARFILRQSVQCRGCNETFNLAIDADGYREWRDGKHIQYALPDLEQRELLISQTCDKCWDELFKETDEPEPEDE